MSDDEEKQDVLELINEASVGCTLKQLSAFDAAYDAIESLRKRGIEHGEIRYKDGFYDGLRRALEEFVKGMAAAGFEEFEERLARKSKH